MWDLALLAQGYSAPAAVPAVGQRRLWGEGWPEQPELAQVPMAWCLPEPTGAPWQCNKAINPLPLLFLNSFCHFAGNTFSWGFQALMGILWFLTVYNSNKVRYNLMGESISLAWRLSVCWILTVSCKLQRKIRAALESKQNGMCHSVLWGLPNLLQSGLQSFKGPLGSVGITVQPQVWNMKVKTALTSDRKTSDHLMHGTLLLTETSVIS